MAATPRQHDPLAAFRRPGAAPATLQPPEVAVAAYRAFATAGGATKPLRLDIRPHEGMAVARPYTAIAEIVYDRPAYTGILIVFSGKLFKLRGRNLQPVVDALIAGTCEFVAQLGEGEEAQDGEPVIESIEAVTPPVKPAAKEQAA